MACCHSQLPAESEKINSAYKQPGCNQFEAKSTPLYTHLWNVSFMKQKQTFTWEEAKDELLARQASLMETGRYFPRSLGKILLETQLIITQAK